MTEFDRRIADAARGQQSLITLADARAAGGGRDHLHHRSQAQVLERVAPRVYSFRAAAPSHDAAILATILSVQGDAVLSHLAAARRFGVPGYRQATTEITVRRGTRLRRTGIRIHESTDLGRCAVVDLGGIPTTDAGRMLLDIGRYIGPQRLSRNVEWCRRAGLVDWSDLIATLATHARRGRPGVRKLRAVLDGNAHRIEVTDTDLELLVLGLLREHGLPEPAVHHEVWEDDRFVAEVDLAYPDQLVGIECDGDIHLLPEVRERDLPRQNDLVLVGWQILRFTSARYWRRPESIVAEVRAALRRATTQPASDR